MDGTFQRCPFKYQTMHFHSVAEGGDTLFVPLKEFYEMQDQVSKHGNKFQVSSAVCTAMLGFGWLICAGESGYLSGAASV